MFRDILVPVDGSAASRRALGHAVELADALEATVHVLTVVEPTRGSLLFGVEEINDLNEAVVDLIESVEDAAGTGVPIRSDVRRGESIHEVILAYADEMGADLVVLTRSNEGSLPTAIFGSTTERVARLSDVPVTILPAPEGE